MPTLKLQLFGRLCARHGRRVLHSFDAGKVQELFCYLSLYPKPHAREMLACMLWTESSTSQAKKYLRQALWQLQATLEANLGPLNRRLALVEADWVQLNPAMDLWLDVAEFEKACVAVDVRPGHELTADSAQSLHNAVQLYQGDLLEGFYQDWCLYERERLQNIYLAALDHLICYCETNQSYQQALTYATEVLRFDPACERTHRHLMRLYFAIGDRTAALRQYQRCLVALKTELGVRPSAQTMTLFEHIQTDNLESSGPLLPEKPTAENATSLLPEVLDHLKSVRSTLSNIQQQVQHDIRIVELALIGRR